MNPALPQRNPCEKTDPAWSPAIELLDVLLAALRAWQPGEPLQSPPTEEDMTALADLPITVSRSPFDAATPDLR
ncbi:hypothetical protein NONO_c41940 [Nocardia nova SH22a]|uniref:Uncharacterized protein n=1 Tax=Nocardia nova SH22a TaxID=1415166 RepID=W5TJ47_9NOCA|nr:hypothetical protein [Nocardia nova]AHH18978.1 hypothetical protein NONO_c41940 [Nocardia nova SH22a]